MDKSHLEISVNVPGVPFHEVFGLAKQLRLTGVDYVSSVWDLLVDPRESARLGGGCGVPVTSIHEPLHLIAYTPSFLFGRMMRAAKLFPHATVYVVHLSSVINYLQQSPSKILLLDKLARDNGMTLAIESNTTSNPILRCYPKTTYRPDAFAAFCIQHGLKMTLDTSHIAACGGDIVGFYRKYHAHISMIHLSDYHGGTEHLLLGKGSLPLEEFLGEIRRTNYTGTICLELEFPGINDGAEKLRQLEESVGFVRRHLDAANG